MNHPPNYEWSMSTWDGQEQLWLRTWEVAESLATVVIVHGLSDHGGRYGELATLFNEGGFSALGADLRGHGLSSGQRGHADSWTALQQDVCVALQAAKQRAPDHPLILLGHSMGGTLVLTLLLDQLEFLQQVDVRAALAWSPLILPTRQPPSWKLNLGRWLSRHFPRTPFRTQIPTAALTHDLELAERFRRDPLRHGRISARLAVEMFAAGRRLADAPTPPAVPCFLLHGTGDAITDYRATERWFQTQDATHTQDATQTQDAPWNTAQGSTAIRGARAELRLWPDLAHELWQERNRREIIMSAVAWCQRINFSAPSGKHNL